MDPANPPLPTPRKRWFQSFSGSHTSKRISESGPGRNTPVTRQNTGRSCKGFSIPGPSRLPEVTLSAVDMVVSASFRCFSALQSAAKTTDVDPSSPSRPAQNLCVALIGVIVAWRCDYIGHHEIPVETDGLDPL